MSSSRLFEFSWPVHQSGYAWGRAAPGSYCPEDEGWYQPLVPVDPDGPVRRYEPLRKHGALFRTFADIDLGFNGEGIVRFANQYGSLGRPPAGYRLEVPGLQVSDGFLDDWDLCRVWWEAIASMGDLVRLWDLLRLGDRARFRDRIRWEENSRVFYDNQPELPQGTSFGPRGERTVCVIASRETRQGWLDYFTPGDVVTPAHFHLMGSVNAWLRGLTDP